MRAGRGEGEGEFVVGPAVRVAEHLVFVDDEQLRPAPVQEPAALGFQGGDDHAGVGAQVHVARADAHVPTGGAPLGVLVVGQRAGRHREHGLPLERGVQQLEDVRFTCAGGGVDNHVAPGAQGADCLLLPQVGDAETGFEGFQGARRRKPGSRARGVSLPCRRRRYKAGGSHRASGVQTIGTPPNNRYTAFQDGRAAGGWLPCGHGAVSPCSGGRADTATPRRDHMAEGGPSPTVQPS